MKDRNNKPLELGDFVEVINSSGRRIGIFAKVESYSPGYSHTRVHLRWIDDNQVSFFDYGPKELEKVEIEDMV